PLASLLSRPLPTLSFLSDAPPTTEIYPLSLHDALPILERRVGNGEQLGAFLPRLLDRVHVPLLRRRAHQPPEHDRGGEEEMRRRSEEHTSELQSRRDLVCRLLLEKKKKRTNTTSRSSCK